MLVTLGQLFTALLSKFDGISGGGPTLALSALHAGLSACGISGGGPTSP